MQLSLLLLASAVSAEFSQFGSKPWDQQALDRYNILRFLGTASPYVSNPGFGISPEVPYNCNVTQVNVVARHGERYPTTNSGKKITKALDRIRNNLTQDELTGALNFLPEYPFDALDPSNYDNETSKGPYSGLSDMYSFGTRFRNIYNNLVEDDSEVKIFAASQKRVVDSAVKFSEGFFGAVYRNVTVLDEDSDILGANSLTPRESCLNYNASINDPLASEFSAKYISQIAERLNTITPELNITKAEVTALLDYCGFDLQVNFAGKPRICDIFTTTELHHRSYENDLSDYYAHGPGHNLTKFIGAAYIDGLIELFDEHSDIKVSAGFTHDTDLFLIYSALGLFENYNPKNETASLPVDHIDFNRVWKVSDIAPMGAHLIFEKLACEVDGKTDDFIRLLVNDAVIPVPGVATGPGYSASWNGFVDYINERLDNKTYSDECVLKNDEVPTQLNFWWDSNL